MTTTAIYLTLITSYSNSFGTGKPSLREAFPKLFRHEDEKQESVANTTKEVNHDEPAIYHDEVAIVKTLLLGIPNWQEWEFSYITIGINILVTLLSLDLVFRGPFLYDGKDLKFSRLGFITDTGARILLRDPNTTNLPIYAYLRPSDHGDWTRVDTIYHLSDETDYTYPLVLSGLNSDTSYTYVLSNDLEGTFKTAPKLGSLEGSSLAFLTSSCIKANFPYNPFAHSLSISGFKYLSKAIRSLPSPASFMLFLGDFIYVDVPLRLASTQNHYRAEYRRVYASPSWDLPGLDMPWIHTLDDHEIANDWAGGNETEPFPAASDPFMHYHVSVNPPLPPLVTNRDGENMTYFQFTQGPASFFMLDTRRYRTQPELRSGSMINTAKPLYGSSSTISQTREGGPTMLGSLQLEALLTFLTEPEPANVRWKIVASSVPFTKNWRFGTSDTWGGFPSEREKVLDAMHFAERNLGVRVVVLSGDRHEFAAIRFPPAAGANSKFGPTYVSDVDTGPHEFSVGPLSMFYLPFRTFKQVDDGDVTLAYFPDGNSKLGAVEISPSEFKPGVASSSRLKYTLWIDGSIAWSHTLHSDSMLRAPRSNLATWKSGQWMV